MNEIFYTLVFILLLFSSCEKQSLDSEEVPEWLRIKIEEIENEITEGSCQWLSTCAWARYTYNRHYYFEFINPISSSFPIVHNFKGDSIEVISEMPDYYEEKCCIKYLWKGPDFFFD